METDDFQAVLATVRDFVRREVVPLEEIIEETDEVPSRLREAAAAMGLFGFALPTEYGGLGLTMSEDVQLAMEVGYTSPAFRSMFGTNNGIAGQVVVYAGTPEQRVKYLPELASGRLIAAFALTEAEAGSDPRGLRTRAARVEGGFQLTGSKQFITNATHAGLFIVFARMVKDDGSLGEISVFAVDAGSLGLAVGPKDRKMGQRGSDTAELSFDEVFVPATGLIGGAEGGGFATAMRSLARGRLHIAALCVGMGERLLEESVSHAATNRQGGRRLAEFQLVQAMLADSHTELYAARALVQQAARDFDADREPRLASSCAKLFCSEVVGRLADRAVQIHGGMGYMRASTVERLYRDARLFRIYEGTSEIQRTIIARQMVANLDG